MAVAKGLVAAAIEIIFKGKSLSKNFKDKLATAWAEKIDSDNDIDNFINARVDDILAAEAEANQRVTDAVKKVTEKKTDPNQPAPAPVNELDPEDESLKDAPPYVKAIMKQLTETRQELAGFKASQNQQTLAERFRADPDLKGLPEFMFKGRIPTKEDEYDTFKEELKADYGTLQAGNPTLPAIGADAPGSGTPPPAAKQGEGVIAPELQAFVASQKAKETVK